MIEAASVKLEKSDDAATLFITGDWNLKAMRETPNEAILSDLDQFKDCKRIAFDCQNLKTWDSSLLIFLLQIEGWGLAHQVALQIDTLPDKISGLIALSQEVPEKKTGRSDQTKHSILYRIGTAAMSAGEHAKASIAFVGECVLSLGRIFKGKGAFDWRLFWLTMEECGAGALGIVGLISFLTGLILGFVGAIQLKQFGAGIYVANLVAVAMAREMAAIMTGIIMAGRTGAAFAAQIGSMKVSEEIDALTTMGIAPMDFLVSPRIWALFLMMPLLVLYSDVIGILGGALVGVGLLKITVIQYWNQTLGAVGLTDIIVGVAKGAIFGAVVAATGCQKGMQCGNNAAAVGNAATSAVVASITMIVASDALFDVIQQIAGHQI
jgi:phospholipid/cholesterol/gamma-HCH transport system permease protein